MARTAAGRQLTARHRQGQLQVRARSLQDYMRLWPLWTGEQGSFERLIAASIPLIRTHHRISSSLAASYFESFRKAERLGGTVAPRVADPVDLDRFEAGMTVTGQSMTRKAIAAGQSPQAAMQTALVRTSGTIGRFVLEGGRDTTVLSTQNDPQAQGYVRVTGGDPCAFCALLAGRGPVFNEDSAAFEAHDHCTCGAEPSYEGSEWPGQAREYKAMYDRATSEARAAGDLSRGTSNDLLNAFRREFTGAK